MKQQHIIGVLVGAIIISGIAFYLGTLYQASKQSPSFANAVAGAGSRRFGGMGSGTRNGFRPVAGDILSADDKGMTVKLQDGSSKIIIFSDKMTVNKAEQATKADIKVGDKVSVFGTDNSDGSVTAQNIQLNPMIGMGRVPTGQQNTATSPALNK